MGSCRNSGTEGGAYSQKVFDLVKPVAKASIELITSGSRQINDKKKELQARVDALRDFLEKNAPKDRHLVQGERISLSHKYRADESGPAGCLGSRQLRLLADAMFLGCRDVLGPEKMVTDDREGHGHASGKTPLARLDRVHSRRRDCRQNAVGPDSEGRHVSCHESPGGLQFDPLRERGY